MAPTVGLQEVPAQYLQPLRPGVTKGWETPLLLAPALWGACSSQEPASECAIKPGTWVFLNTKLSEAPGRETVFSFSLTHFPVYFPSRLNGMTPQGQVRLGGHSQTDHQEETRAAPTLLAQCQLTFWNHRPPSLGKLLIPLLSLRSFVSIQEL